MSSSMCSKDLVCSMRMRLSTKLWFFRHTAYYSWHCKPLSQSANPRRESRQGMRYCSGIDRQSMPNILRRHLQGKLRLSQLSHLYKCTALFYTVDLM